MKIKLPLDRIIFLLIALIFFFAFSEKKYLQIHVNQRIVASKIRPKDRMKMVYVPGGEFIMGYDKEKYGYPIPEHPVYLDSFWIDQTEVTIAMYDKCVSSGNCSKSYYSSAWTGKVDEKGKNPVVGITWNQADEYCRWVKGRLPTEAEWEKAARGTTGFIYPWGNELPIIRYGNYHNNIPGGGTMPVGSFPQGVSPYGALDMDGNAYEFVYDWFEPSYYYYSPYKNPSGPATGFENVLRGGSWGMHNNVVHRFRVGGKSTNYLIGFRCAMSEQ